MFGKFKQLYLYIAEKPHTDGADLSNAAGQPLRLSVWTVLSVEPVGDVRTFTYFSSTWVNLSKPVHVLPQAAFWFVFSPRLLAPIELIILKRDRAWS